MQCPTCGSYSVERRGIRNDKRRYECQERDCEHPWFTGPLEKEDLETGENFQAPKVLVFDIETSLIEMVGFGIHKQHISKDQITSDWFMLSWAAKWLYDDKVFGDVLTSQEAKNKKDIRIVKSLWNMVDEADIVITYNGNSFDIPRIKTRFLIHRMIPPSYFKSIDVYSTISSQFGFTSNAMDFVNMELELERKRTNGGFELWKRCQVGDSDALQEMSTYNQGDIISLEQGYFRVRPWINNHPNMGLYHDNDGPVCKYCGSEDLNWSKNPTPILSGLYKTFRCNNCNGIGRSRTNLLTKEQRKFLTA